MNRSCSLLTKLVVSLAALAIVVSCVPVQAWDVPNFKGRIHRSSTPIADATVAWVELTPPPPDPGEELARWNTHTDSSGRFEIAGERRWAGMPLLPGSAPMMWRVELEQGETRTVLWEHVQISSVASTPARVELDCDLDLEDPCLLVDTDDPDLLPSNENERLPSALRQGDRAVAVEPAVSSDAGLRAGDR